MAVRIGTNGFGRIGRLGLRAARDDPELDFVHINEIAGDAACAAHLLKFDSIHGRFAPEDQAEAGAVVVDGTQVKILAWYDNEIGYANRLMDLVRKIAGLLSLMLPTHVQLQAVRLKS